MMIQLESVTKLYRAGENAIRALDEVNLDIDRGEYVAIVGLPAPARAR